MKRTHWRTARRVRNRLAVAAIVSMAAGVLAVTQSAGASPPRSQIPQVVHVRVLPDADAQLFAPITPQAAANAALKTYASTVTDLGKTYTYRMVGTNPEVRSATSNSSTISTVVIPLIVKFSNGDVFSPTMTDSCDPGATPIVRVQKSPLFNSRAWTWGGTSIGTGQYIDAFERAEFWHYVRPIGSNPGYGIQLALSVHPAITVTVPLADSAERSGTGCGIGKLGVVSPSWALSYIKSVLVPLLPSFGISPRDFPIFLTHNVVVGTPTSCCVLGIHSALSTPQGLQTFAFADYENSGSFGVASEDVSVLAHEVGEWVNDPFVNNATRPWGHVGQVANCQANLEVGDPLSGTSVSVPELGFTYHPQELAFFSWFYRQAPSLGVNGWYSNKGTFKTTQGTCT